MTRADRGTGTLVEAGAGLHPVVAEALSMCPVIDGHNDLPGEARIHAGYSTENLRRGSQFHTDVERLRRGGVGAQFWSVWCPADEAPGAESVVYTLEQMDFVYRLIQNYPDEFVLARTGDDVRRAWRDGKIASLIGAEGGHSIDGSLGTLRLMARLGLRYMTLTHFLNNTWADSATDVPLHGGLTSFGRDVVAEMNRLGVLVDLSHVAPTTMRDALDVSSAPVIFSHSSCSGVTPHPRNVPDDVLARLSVNGGVQMITFVAMFLSQDYEDWYANGASGQAPVVTVDDVADHIEHAREVAGIDHIGLGGDYDGCQDFPVGMDDVASYPMVLENLANRGWSARELSQLQGGNILRVLDDTSEAALSALDM